MTVPKTPVVVLDTAEPERLARFYAGLLGATTRPAPDDADLVLMRNARPPPVPRR
ncbi:VOC family protein [Streptomyces lavendulae]|uniref:VOC family protein n=1 Tax=Streptomyces lavendulae TaxID=1914 RepID=UPI00247C45B9|nr:hypothetical protein [Streptomyces sp. SPB4]